MVAFVAVSGFLGRKSSTGVVCAGVARVPLRRAVVMQEKPYNYFENFNRETNGAGSESDQGGNTEASETSAGESVDKVKSDFQNRVDDVEKKIEETATGAQETVTGLRDDFKEAAERNAQEAKEDLNKRFGPQVEELTNEVKSRREEFRTMIREFVDENFSPEFWNEVDYDKVTEMTNSNSVEQIKNMMLYALTSTDRGIAASAEQAKEIITYISVLEKLNPTAEPNSSSDLFGKWKLVYTTSPNFLVLSSVPFLKLGQVFQEIKESDSKGCVDIEANAYIEPFFGPLFRTLAGRSSAEIKVELEAEKSGAARLKIKTLKPTFTGVSLLGQSLDSLPSLSGMKGGAPHGAFLDTVFLDSNMRIGRTIANNVFVLVRE